MNSKLLTNYLHPLINQILAAEVSAISKYFDCLMQWQPLPESNLDLFHRIENPLKTIVSDFEKLNWQFKSADKNKQYSQILLLDRSLHYEEDIQKFLSKLKNSLNRQSRIVAIVYNSWFSWLYVLAKLIGLRIAGEPTCISLDDAYKLARLSGLELVRIRRAVYVPFKLWGLGDFLNAWLPCIPILKQLCFFYILVLRPIVQEPSKPSLSVIIPVKNEKGNLENVFKTLSVFADMEAEIIFVEGNSTDGSQEEIKKLISLQNCKLPILALQQKGQGKSDAVQLGFAHAKNDLLVILDSDLSTPVEFLKNFYEAYCAGLGDFINGNRLFYPLAKGSMPFLNKLGNVFFVKALNLVLQTAIGDSLCGSKMFSRYHYQKFCQWKKDFGERDPFGDFNLLFPAAILGLGIVDIPVRYKERIYGSTNIRRFSDGWILFKMVLSGFFCITLGHTNKPAAGYCETTDRHNFSDDVPEKDK